MTLPNPFDRYRLEEKYQRDTVADVEEEAERCRRQATYCLHLSDVTMREADAQDEKYGAGPTELIAIPEQELQYGIDHPGIEDLVYAVSCTSALRMAATCYNKASSVLKIWLTCYSRYRIPISEYAREYIFEHNEAKKWMKRGLNKWVYALERCTYGDECYHQKFLDEYRDHPIYYLMHAQFYMESGKVSKAIGAFRKAKYLYQRWKREIEEYNESGDSIDDEINKNIFIALAKNANMSKKQLCDLEYINKNLRECYEKLKQSGIPFVDEGGENEI